MKILLLYCIGSWLTLATLTAQPVAISQVNTSFVRHFTVDNRYYTSNYQGLRNYMNELATTEPDLHQQLLPHLMNIDSKRQQAWAVYGIGGGVGLALCLSELGRANESTNSTVPIAGVLIMATSLLLGRRLEPNVNDIFSFFNTHNQLNASKPMRWELGLHTTPTTGTGLRLAVGF